MKCIENFALSYIFPTCMKSEFLSSGHMLMIDGYAYYQRNLMLNVRSRLFVHFESPIQLGSKIQLLWNCRILDPNCTGLQGNGNPATTKQFSDR